MASSKGKGRKAAPSSGRNYGPALSRQPQYRDGADQRLVNAIQAAAAESGYKVELQSGLRYTGQGGAQHPKGNAIDVQLYDAQGREIPNYKSAENFRTYENFAQKVKQKIDDYYPELSESVRWGGYFSGKEKYGALDLMHFDVNSGVGMAGGTWEKGLTKAQSKLWPGAQSVGMSAFTGQSMAPTNDFRAPAGQRPEYGMIGTVANGLPDVPNEGGARFNAEVQRLKSGAKSVYDNFMGTETPRPPANVPAPSPATQKLRASPGYSAAVVNGDMRAAPQPASLSAAPVGAVTKGGALAGASASTQPGSKPPGNFASGGPYSAKTGGGFGGADAQPSPATQKLRASPQAPSAAPVNGDMRAPPSTAWKASPIPAFGQGVQPATAQPSAAPVNGDMRVAPGQTMTPALDSVAMATYKKPGTLESLYAAYPELTAPPPQPAPAVPAPVVPAPQPMVQKPRFVKQPKVQAAPMASLADFGMPQIGVAPSGARLYSDGREINGVNQVFTGTPNNAFGALGYNMPSVGAIPGMQRLSDLASNVGGFFSGWGGGSGAGTSGGGFSTGGGGLGLGGAGGMGGKANNGLGR